ncbi:MAG: hypothetical protein WBQ34_05365 [Candidatus Acidiferrales bacterium]
MILVILNLVRPAILHIRSTAVNREFRDFRYSIGHAATAHSGKDSRKIVKLIYFG